MEVKGAFPRDTLYGATGSIKNAFQVIHLNRSRKSQYRGTGTPPSRVYLTFSVFV